MELINQQVAEASLYSRRRIKQYAQTEMRNQTEYRQIFTRHTRQNGFKFYFGTDKYK